MHVLHDVRQKAASQVQLTCTDTTTVQTAAPPAGAIACEITVETNAARVSFNGVAPAATNGFVFPKDVAKVYCPYAVPIKAVSTIAGNSIVNVLWLT